MRGSVRILRIAGIDIGIHYTWFFAIFIIAWSLAQGFFPDAYPGWRVSIYWLAGVLSAVLLFVSVLLHELAHSLVAQARGLPVSSITLFIFGGVSNLKEEPEKPFSEFIMAIGGPATSLALAGVFWGIGQVLVGEGTFFEAIITYLAVVNLGLAVFNMLPGFPLDGGRVLRSILWKTTGNLVRATTIAAVIGRLFGWGFILFGAFWIFWMRDFLGGIWIAIIGIFLNSAAESSRQEVTLKDQLTGVSVRQVMDLNADYISPVMSVADLVRDVFLQKGRRAIPVMEGERLVGMVTITDVRKVPQDMWTATAVSQIMTRQPIHSVRPDADLSAAMKIIAQHDLNQVPVLDQGRLVGILSRSRILNFLQLSQELGLRAGRRRVS